MMPQDSTRFVPVPEGAAAHGVAFACRPDQLQCPRRMGLIDNISRNRRLSNGYRHTTDLGHRMKWNQEAENKLAHARLSANRLFRGIAASLNILDIKLVEDLQIFLVPSADV